MNILYKNMLRDTAKSALDLPRAKVGVPYTDLKYLISQYIFPLGKMNGTVRSRTSFILSNQSWEIGNPPTGGAGRMKLFCVVPASVIFGRCCVVESFKCHPELIFKNV